MRQPRWLSLILLIFTLAARAETVAKMPSPTAYVNDYANVLHSIPQSDMEALCTELHDKTKAQVFVVTVGTTGDTPIEEFANQLFHNWKIGEKKTDRGALILLAVKDHKYRIEVGYGLEGILNDAKVGDIGRSMVPALRASDYDAAATTSLRAVAQMIADDSHITLNTLQQSTPSPASAEVPADSSNQSIPIWLFWCIWFGIFGFVIAIIIIGKLRGWKSNNNTFWTSGSSSDSSSSSSDSSSSFTGGDGGDSGGGGASGSW